MASSSSPGAAAGSSKAPATEAAKQQNGRREGYIDWSIYPSLTVKFAFLRRLTFRDVKRYTTVGQLRELVAQELMLPSPCVGLHADGNALSLNALLLEDALGDVRTLHMVRAGARSHIATSPHLHTQ